MARRRTIGFIGLGAMGNPIAMRILDAGWNLVVYSRSPEASHPFANRGATVAVNPREVAEESDIVFIMVTDDEAVRDVVFSDNGVLAGLSDGKILVNMTTSSPALTLELKSAASGVGARTLDVKVSGSVDAAESGNLLVLIGGDPQVINRVCNVLDLLGRKVIRTGEHGTAATLKLALNLMLGLEMEALAEAFAFARKSGIPSGVISEAISISGMASPFITGKLKLIISNDLAKRFSLRLMQKDLALVLSEGARQSVPLPATAAANEMAKAGMARGYGALDAVSLYTALAKISGIKPESATSARSKEPAQSV